MKKYYDPQWQPCYRGQNCSKKPLVKVKDTLFEAYSHAVQIEEADGQSFTNSQLVYFKQSPDFCQRNIMYGVPGTSGRQCYPDQTDHSSCENLCCGASMEERIFKHQIQCNCKFVWCCHVKCETCTKIITNYYCK